MIRYDMVLISFVPTPASDINELNNFESEFYRHILLTVNYWLNSWDFIDKQIYLKFPFIYSENKLVKIKLATKTFFGVQPDFIP